MTTYDLAVVGAGPAGATAALSALTRRPDLRVLLLDRAEFPRDKCCGDGIAPHVLDVLEGLGAADVVDGWSPLRRLELARGDARVSDRLARPVYVVPRQVFDAALVERAVAAGARLERHRVRTVEVRDAASRSAGAGGTVRLDGLFSARVVVGADGAYSAVRAATDPRPQPRRALALRGYAPTAPGRAGTQLIRFGDRPQPAYAWAFDRGDGLSNVGYGELAGGAPLSRELLLSELDRLIPGAVDSGSQWRAHHLPLSGFGRGARQPDGPVLLAGDAAGLVNPMTGEGIYYAVATGALAGRAAVEAIEDGTPASAGARHRTAVRSRLGRHLRHTWAAGRLSRHPLVLQAGIRAANRDQRVFDDLVEIGLGDGLIDPHLAGALVRGLVPRPRARR